MLHLLLHFLVPLVVLGFVPSGGRIRAYIILISTMLVDADHLLATPIYDPLRCSIGFHPLHTFWPIAAYGVMCFFQRTRLAGVGLCIHMALDAADCWKNIGVFYTP